jgi:ABC-type multidrug transport system fused ATPase/permease subunit
MAFGAPDADGGKDDAPAQCAADLNVEAAAAWPEEPRLLGEAHASLVSRALFTWVSPLVSRGYRRKLQPSELFELWPEDRADALADADAAFCAASAPAVPTLHARLRHATRRHLLQASCCRLFYSASQLAAPMLLRRLVRSVALQQPVGDGLLWAFLLAGTTVSGAVCEQAHQNLALRAGRRGRSLATTLVFRHCMTLSTAGLSARDPGDVANLLSSDANRLLLFTPMVAQLWSGPAQIAVSTWLLVDILGVRALAGVGMLLALLPVLTLLANKQRRLRAAHLPAADARVRLVGEAARGMRGLKFAGWERAFLDRILGAREEENRFVRAELLLTAATISIAIVLPQFATAATFAAVAVPDNRPLQAADAFAALSLFNVLRFPLMNLGEAVAGSAQLRVSVDRLAGLLATPEVVAPSAPAGDAASGVVAQDAAFWWPPTVRAKSSKDESDAEASGTEFRLHGVSLRVAPGELLIVLGQVGAGKSTLLQGLLGESCGEGAASLTPRSRVAYASQNAFLLNGTLRDNILFGRAHDAARYAAVVSACCLLPDVASLPARDYTIIGERGVTLSGGQRARVALARALYGDPLVLLLDDVLSALDADTGRAVFSAALGPAGLARKAARILVTHATQYLSQASAVAILDGGVLAACGPHAELLAAAKAGTLSPGAAAQLAAASVQEEAAERRASVDTRRSVDATAAALKPAADAKAPGATLGEEEDQSRDGVSWQTISAYVAACGGAPWAVMQLLLLLCERLTYVSTDYMLTTWNAAALGPPDTVFGRFMDGPMSWGPGLHYGLRHAAFYACAYTLCCAVNGVFAVARTVWFSAAGARAAGRMFAGAATAVVRSPLIFFETTPTGRILNRLCADQDVLDTTLPVTCIRLTSSVAWLISALAIMIGVLPPVALPVVVALCGYIWGVSRFISAYSQLQRLEANARTPLQVHVQEALAGAAIVRAFGASERFVAACDAHCDTAAAASLAFQSAGRWFSVRLEMAAGAVLLSVGITCTLLRSTVGAPLAGLALIWASNFSLSLSFFTMALTDFQSKSVSIERLRAYCLLPSEPAWQAAPPPDGWPLKGRVVFESAVLRYRPELPPALKSLSFEARPGERLGIVGRTGAGKSTIAAALLRLRDLSSGRILLDGVDLGVLGLADVRRGVCAIPQEPLLLTGSVRYNLDPFNASANDADAWDALRAVRMADPVAALGGGLDAPVADGGSNFSVGERQLLCFARALLRRPRVLLLDEATASCDEVSDAAIQRALRASFADVTVMSIAHRLATVMDYDRILVMSDGAAAECDAPDALLAQPAGALTALVAALGPATATHLRAVAKNAAADKRS